MRRLLLLTAFLLSLWTVGCGGDTSKNEVKNIKEDVEVKVLIPQKDYALLIVESKSCIYCKQMDKDMREDKNLKEAIKNIDVFKITYENLTPVKTNITGKEMVLPEKELAQTLNALSFPYLIFFNKKGEIVLRIPGYIEPRTMVCVIDYVQEGAYNQYKVEDYLKKKNCA